MPFREERSLFQSNLQRRRLGQARGRRLRRAALSLLTAALSALLVLEALAAPGDLDTTFDGDGIVRTEFINGGSETAWGMAVQPDGKIVVVGNSDSPVARMAVARYNADGSLDSSFDGDGKMTTLGPANREARATAVALQADGKIVVAGYSLGAGGGFALVRLNADGSLDTPFGAGGKVATAFGNSDDVARTVFVQPDGRIILTGYIHVSGSGFTYQFGLARFNADGSPDASFGAGGKVASPTNHEGPAWSAALQRDGKIVVVGDTFSPGGFALERYNSNGSLDTSFGASGRVTTNGGRPRAAAIQPDGKIVVAGTSAGGILVRRYDATGALDTSFGAGGEATSSGLSPQAVALQPDGKIVLAGAGSGGTSGNDFALARFNRDGSPDDSFGAGGKLTTPVSQAIDDAYALAIQPDGRILAAGWADNGTGAFDYDFAIVRYAGDAKPNRVSNFDADRRTDIALWNPASGNWRIFKSADPATLTTVNWGANALGDRAVPGDYDGDNKADIAVWRPSDGNWYILKSSDGSVAIRNWGNSTDTPVPGDYDLDGLTDAAVYRPSEGVWYILNSRDNTVTARNWGASGDVPAPADYDGDGQTDLAVWRPATGNWHILTSRDNFAHIVNWGDQADKLVPADYDGDGRTDVAVFRPATGNWHIRLWTGSVITKNWGDATDTPAPADYDGDGKTDIAVRRNSTGNWHIIHSADNTQSLAHFSEPGIPLANAYLPQ